MRILIIGGTGMIGFNTALHLQSLGHEVHLAARSTPKPDHPAAQFPVLTGDFTKAEFTKDDLSPFDAIVFAAGNDPRHMPANADVEEFYRKTQSEGVPAFAELARDAGVKRFVQVGSYYHHLRPGLAENSIYIRARQLADDRTRVLSRDGFCAVTVNPPSIVGAVPGLRCATGCWRNGAGGCTPTFRTPRRPAARITCQSNHLLRRLHLLWNRARPGADIWWAMKT